MLPERDAKLVLLWGVENDADAAVLLLFLVLRAWQDAFNRGGIGDETQLIS